MIVDGKPREAKCGKRGPPRKTWPALIFDITLAGGVEKLLAALCVLAPLREKSVKAESKSPKKFKAY